MTRFSVDGVYIDVLGAYMDFNLQSYYATVEIDTLLYLKQGTKIKIENESSVTVVVLSSVFNKTQYHNVCVSEDQMQMLCIKTPVFQGETTVKGLLSTLGLQTSMTDDSNSTWWMLPSMGFKDIIYTLNKLVEFPNGGAPRFYMDLGGKILWTDLVRDYNQKPEPCNGSVVSDITDVEWMLQVPGNIQLIHSDKDKIEKEEISINDKLPWAKVICCDFNTNNYKNVKRAFTNEFNTRTYLSRKIVVSNVITMPHRIGQCVLVNDKVQGVVIGVTIPFILNEESLLLQVKVACPGLLEL